MGEVLVGLFLLVLVGGGILFLVFVGGVAGLASADDKKRKRAPELLAAKFDGESQTAVVAVSETGRMKVADIVTFATERGYRLDGSVSSRYDETLTFERRQGPASGGE
jgi:hypothetical protein